MTRQLATPPTRAAAEPSEERRGLVFGLTAHVLWGAMPVYFLTLAPAGPFEIVSWRILFSLVVCAILLTATRTWSRIRVIVRRPRTMLLMGLAGALIFANWLTYVIASVSGHVVEAALGYFINPIVTVFLGVFILRERLRLAQWIAIGVAFVAVVVLAIAYGAPPWISLILAFSFGGYGLVKKFVGRDVDAVSGLTLETVWLTPVAAVVLGVVASTTGISLGADGPLHAALLASAGVVTAVPLLLFAGAARRLPLVMLGLIQFLTPILQFVLGVTVLHEAMPPERLAGFGLVWIALVILVVDMIVAARSSRRTVTDPLS